MSDSFELEVSDKYAVDNMQQRAAKPQYGFFEALSHHCDEHRARRALHKAGEPGLVLDLLCGDGRFWPLLAEKPNRIIIAADHAPETIQAALERHPDDIAKRVVSLATSLIDVDLPDGSVDSIFCMRMIYQHVAAEHRLTMLREFHRVTRETVILSIWTGGDLKSWQRRHSAQRYDIDDSLDDYQDDLLISRAQAEAEFRQAGFVIESRTGFLPFCANWRVYVLGKR